MHWLLALWVKEEDLRESAKIKTIPACGVDSKGKSQLTLHVSMPNASLSLNIIAKCSISFKIN